MCFKNTAERWGGVSQSLHWLIFFLFLFMFLLAEVMMGMVVDEKNTFFGAGKWELYGLHKSFGVLIFGLVALRLVWRLFNTAPHKGEKMNRLEKAAAHTVHLGLYGVMLAMPLSGYTMSMAGGFGVKFFGSPVPDFIGKNEALGELAHSVHGWTWTVFYVLISLHVLGALYHYYAKQDNVLQRMLPVRK
jgi:cytochrome b561